MTVCCSSSEGNLKAADCDAQDVGLVQCLAEDLEWMLTPAAQLLKCLNGLSQPGSLAGDAAALQAMLELSPLEKAAAVGQSAFLNAKSRADELEPDRMDPASLHGVRGWYRQSRELVRLAPTLRGCGLASACFTTSPA